MLSTPPPQESGYFGASHSDGQNFLSQEDVLSIGNPRSLMQKRKLLASTPHLGGGPSRTQLHHGLTQTVVTMMQCKTATTFPGAVVGAIPTGAIAGARPLRAIAGRPATRPMAIGPLAKIPGTLIAGMDQVTICSVTLTGAGPEVTTLIVGSTIVIPAAQTGTTITPIEP